MLFALRRSAARLLLGGSTLAAVASAAHLFGASSSAFAHAHAPVAAVGMSHATLASNPLLSSAFFPRFADVQPEHVPAAIDAALASAAAGLAALEASVEEQLAAGRTPAYELMADGLERLEEEYSAPWRTISHLKATKDSEALRTAHAAAQPNVVAFDSQLGQSQALYRGWERLKADSSAWGRLTPAQQRVVELMLLGAELKGVALVGAQKERFNEIEQQLAALSTKFSNNLMDSVKAYSLRLTEEAQIAGLPPSARAMLAANARSRGDASATAEAGPWTVTLDEPSRLAVMRFADDRALRETIYRAAITRASLLALDVPLEARTAQDNAPLIDEVLRLRAERAKLLGRASHAEVSVSSKMATLAQAKGLLEDLRARCLDAALAEHKTLEQFAGYELKQWDVGHAAEQLKKAKYEFDEEAVRPFLPLDGVLQGLFALVERLFDVQLVAVDDPARLDAQVWEPSVKLLEVRRANEAIAYIYIDPFARAAEKRGGAWMSQVRSRSRALAPEGKRVCLPIAHIVTNQAPPTIDAAGQRVPSLMSFSECRTLFHECGHALQHVLTAVDEGHVSGIAGVEWDAVEQPSQWLENWLMQPSVLQSMAKHWASGEPIPTELIAKIRAADTFRAASGMLRQLRLASVDLELHDAFVPGASERTIWDVERSVEQRMRVLPPLEEDRFLCGFRHIFAGGYSAGYFSYKWAEVLSADGFAAFEEAGLEDEAAVRSLGRKYAETVLGMGGSRPAAEVFLAFRGREPQVDALLRHNDLLPKKAVPASVSA